MVQLSRREWLFGLALTACATTSGIEAGGGDKLFPDEVRVRILGEQQGGSAWKPLRSGSTVRSGDRFRLELQAAKPIFVYALRIEGSGRTTAFYSSSSDAPFPAAGSLMLPTDAEFYTLGLVEGTEDMRVVASLSPLSPEQVQAAASLQKSARDADRTPPPILVEEKRDPCWVRARLGTQGVTVARLLLLHKQP
jgi:hypothetical protein